MSKLFIIRGIRADELCHEADIGMNNILAMGRYQSVKTAKRYLGWNDCLGRAKKQGYAKIALFDMQGVLTVEACGAIKEKVITLQDGFGSFEVQL